jgi:hypothetical protein
VVAAPGPSSLTVAVHVVACPGVTDVGEQPTKVDVPCTAITGATPLAGALAAATPLACALAVATPLACALAPSTSWMATVVR